MTDRPMMHVDHPDDERFDEITIKVVERWKESELSGDEWRFSYVTEFKRKGEVVIRSSSNRLQWAMESLFTDMRADEGRGFSSEAFGRTVDRCCQPGCTEVATVFYKRLKRYTPQGEDLAPSTYYDGREFRQFCNRHKWRGDCGLDDADHNYEKIDKP